MNIIQRWNNTNLILRIAGGIVIGTILALLIPQATGIGILGTLFVGALKAIAPVLIFVLVISALSRGKSNGSSIFRIVILYIIGTLAAAVTAVVVFSIFPVSLPLTDIEEIAGSSSPDNLIQEISDLVVGIIVNPLLAVVNGQFLGILFWAILFGLAFRKSSDNTKNFIKDVSDMVSKVVKWIISFAPFGILGLVFTAVSSSGLGIFADYGLLILVLTGTMAAVIFIINPIIVYTQIHQNPYPLLFRCLKVSFIPAFFTRSSAANIPINMELCRSLKLNENTYSTSIPLGASINMAGAAVTISIMTLACAYTLGIDVPIYLQILLCFVAALAACGASGVAGGSLLLIPVACSLFGIPSDISMQVVGIGFIISVILDSMETGLNSSTDALITAAVEFREMKKAGKPISLKTEG
ncbi:MAG: serine/threonine transporter SstT [Methanocorpusculum sp.]|nr:serine/threonine transporter SstT [Methanocorpusculum sp.]